MGNRTWMNKGRLSGKTMPVVALAALSAFGFCSTKCPKPQDENIMTTDPAENRQRAVVEALTEIEALGKESAKNREAVLAGFEKIGSLTKGLKSEDILALYKEVKEDLTDIDKRLRSRNSSSLELAAAVSTGKSLTAAGKIGAVLFVIPSLENENPDDAVLTKPGYAMSFEIFVSHLDRGGTEGRKVGGWIEGKEPFTDESLLFLFESIRHR